MRRRKSLAVALGIGLILLPGCRLKGLDDLLDDRPVTTAAFWTGACIGAVPGVLACAPFTLPAAAGSHGEEALLYLLGPGIFSGFVTGIVFAIPTLLLETVFRFPLSIVERIANRSTGERTPAPPATESSATTIISYPAGAQVFLDGRAVGRTPLAVVFPNRGSVTVGLQLSGGPRHEHEVQRDPGAGPGEGAGWEPVYEFDLR